MKTKCQTMPFSKEKTNYGLNELAKTQNIKLIQIILGDCSWLLHKPNA